MRWKKFDGPSDDGGRYGTWFFAMPGSGIFVNIGKAIRFSNRKKANILKPEKRDRRKGAKKLSTAKHRERLGGTLGTPKDWFYCIGARQLGYDTVIVSTDDAWYLKHHSGIKRNQLEVTICGDMNNTNTLCPTSFELRTNMVHGNYSERCICDEAQPYLTCK